MPRPLRLVFPIEKAVYLFSRDSVPGQGGDKQKFWRQVMGFSSPESIRAAILERMSLADLVFQRQDQYGERYQAVVMITGPSGVTGSVQTAWIVRSGEAEARFVTAFPVRSGRD